MPTDQSPSGPPDQQARIDLYVMVVGECGLNQKFEVAAVYVHSLPSFLPVRVVKAILKEEFEPEEISLWLSRRSSSGPEGLGQLFLEKVREAAIIPLRKETYGAPPQAVQWYFFDKKNLDTLAKLIRKLN